jgi:NAD(P)-dependent dehydrogenase (short-subunit alcohol dehydrogenase family)
MIRAASSDKEKSMRLAGKSAIVTGGGRGIGQAICEVFAREGCQVLVTDLDVGNAEAVAAGIRARGGTAEYRMLDVSRQEEVGATVKDALAAFGKLDIMVNNAGVGGGHGWEQTVEVNLSGVYYGCLAAAETMAASGGGAIVNTASVAGIVGLGGAFPYVAAKHGVVGLTREFALAYGPRGVRVNCVCPGWVETEMTRMIHENEAAKRRTETQTPLGRLGQPAEIANAFLFLASEEASFMTGAALVIDGGWTAR